MSELTDRQIRLSRRQLEFERMLMSRGMSPRDAEQAAVQAILFGEGMALHMDRDMDAGNGADLDNLEAAATPIEMDAGLGRVAPPQSERVFRDDPTGGLAAMVAAREAEPAPLGTRVPGPVDLGTGRSAAGEPMFSEEEIAAYELRQPAGNEAQRAAAQLMGGGPYRGGDFMPSQEDEDMYRRGMVYTINPQTGEGGYSVAYPQMNEAGTPGAPGRLGTRNDLRGMVRDSETGGYLRGTHKYEKAVRDSPLGQVEVYAPTDEFRRELAERDLFLRQQRLAVRAGVAGPAAEGAPDPAAMDLNQLRALGNARLAQDKAARQQALQRTRMAQTNPLEYMNRGDISDWNRMVAADRMLRRGYRGATPLDVDEATQQALALQESRRAITEGFRPLTPAQERAQNAQANAAEAEAADTTYKTARGIVGQYADDKAWTNYLSRVFSGGTDFHDPTVFTAEERRKAIAQLQARYPHLSDAEAAETIDAAASNTTYVD